MGNPQKDKGKKIEREVAELFSKTYGLNFQRIPNSGAFVGGLNASRMASMSNSQILLHKGDIIPPDELPWLTIECKGRKKFEFHQLFDRSLDLNDWIDQTEVDWDAQGRRGVFLVVIKPNLRGFFVCTRNVFRLSDVMRPRMHYWHNKINYVVQRLDEKWLLNAREQLFKYCGRDPYVFGPASCDALNGAVHSTLNTGDDGPSSNTVFSDQVTYTGRISG